MKYSKIILWSLTVFIFVGCANKRAEQYANYLKQDFTNNDVILVYSLEKDKNFRCNDRFSADLEGNDIGISQQICNKGDGFGLLVRAFMSKKEDDFSSKSSCGNLFFLKLKKGKYKIKDLNLYTFDVNGQIVDSLLFNTYKNRTLDLTKNGIYYLGNFNFKKILRVRDNCILPKVDLEIKNQNKRDLTLFLKKYPNYSNEKIFDISDDGLKETKERKKRPSIFDSLF